VWFPEGEVMEHGASPEGDVVAVFITNKPFRIDWARAVLHHQMVSTMRAGEPLHLDPVALS
jgi:hypothetical protein